VIRGENTPLGCGTSSRRAGTRALPRIARRDRRAMTVLGLCVGPSPGGIASSSRGRGIVTETVDVLSSAAKIHPSGFGASSRRAGTRALPEPQLLGAIFRKTKYTTKASPNPTNQA
jgi:hypothetical protein